MVRRATKMAEDLPAAHRPRRDSGVTFIELLVAVILLGTSVVAVLTAVRATVTASSIDTDHARAFEWLQAASDAVYKADRVPCAKTALAVANANAPSDWTSNKGSASVPSSGTVWTEYQTKVNAVPPPVGWAGGKIAITAIEFLGRATPDAPTFEWASSYCYEGVQLINGNVEDFRESPFYSQRITIQVTSPNGRVVKTINTVKGD
jgi:type II secretory pathway pseudopilin PulG